MNEQSDDNLQLNDPRLEDTSLEDTSSEDPLSTSHILYYALLFGAIFLAIALGLYVNLINPTTLPPDPQTQLDLFQQAELPTYAHPIYQQLIDADPANITLHYQYINNYFAMPLDEQQAVTPTLTTTYQTLTQDPATHDLGHYALGQIASQQTRYETALNHYQQVNNRDLPYLNNSTGYVLVQLKQDEAAEAAFWREIEIDGNITGALFNLTDLYQRQQRPTELAALYQNDRTKLYLTPDVQAWLAWHQRQPLDYLRHTISRINIPYTSLAILSTLLICAMWLLYLWRIDIFEQEPFPLMLLALGLGALSPFLTFILSDFLHALWPLELGTGFFNDLFFNIIHIGLVEEISKFIPVIIIMTFFSREVDEPIDLLIYGSLSALGFATLENALYFSSYGPSIIFNRFLLSTIGHLADTTIICYFWAHARFIQPRPVLPAILLGLGLATLAHGLYDYFLLALPEAAILSIILLFVMAEIYGNMLHNALNFSPYYHDHQHHTDRLDNYALILATSILIILIIYLHQVFTYSTELANGPLRPIGFFTIFGIVAVFATLFELTLEQGHLRPLYQLDKTNQASSTTADNNTNNSD
ncbi:MAG TPA: PrsW family intramembrane metalloprotease [Anaerolineae bacterium]|nr:PrsW family intramembrane metalloprotease [Anaerolineae bacterium]